MKQVWIPSNIQGKDGKSYWVYTMYAAGRGWYHRQYFIFKDTQYREIEVELAGFDSLVYFGSNGRKGTLVNILSDKDLQVVVFSRNPYMKKDGTFEHVHTYDYQLKKLYGIQVVTPERNYLANLYGQPVIDFVKERGEVCLCEIETNRLKRQP